MHAAYAPSPQTGFFTQTVEKDVSKRVICRLTPWFASKFMAKLNF